MDAVLAGRVAALETWWQDLQDADRTAAADALEAVGCGGLGSRRVGTLSLGERARVLIARALVGEPELLLFDEPAAGLDLPARERLLSAMRAAGSRPGLAASIVTTHHLEDPGDRDARGAAARGCRGGLRAGRGGARGRSADGLLRDADRGRASRRTVVGPRRGLERRELGGAAVPLGRLHRLADELE